MTLQGRGGSPGSNLTSLAAGSVLSLSLPRQEGTAGSPLDSGLLAPLRLLPKAARATGAGGGKRDDRLFRPRPSWEGVVPTGFDQLRERGI